MGVTISQSSQVKTMGSRRRRSQGRPMLEASRPKLHKAGWHTRCQRHALQWPTRGSSDREYLALRNEEVGSCSVVGEAGLAVFAQEQ